MSHRSHALLVKNSIIVLNFGNFILYSKKEPVNLVTIDDQGLARLSESVPRALHSGRLFTLPRCGERPPRFGRSRRFEIRLTSPMLQVARKRSGTDLDMLEPMKMPSGLHLNNRDRCALRIDKSKRRRSSPSRSYFPADQRRAPAKCRGQLTLRASLVGNTQRARHPCRVVHCRP